MIKWADYIIDKYRVITNVSGTVVIAWLLSALVCQGIAMILPRPDIALPSPLDTDSTMQTLLSQSEGIDFSFYLPICERNIFDSQKSTECYQQFTEEVDPNTSFDPNAAPVKSDIGAKLLGTMVFPDNADASFATIEISGSNKPAGSFYVGQDLMGQAKIYEIVRNRVYINRQGRREYLEMDNLPTFQAEPAARNTPSDGIVASGDNIKITRSKVDATLQDLNKVLTDSRMVPNYENGIVNGFKVWAIRSGSIFDQLGLKNGDLIQRINGTKIDALEKALPMLEIVKTESNVNIDLVRNGEKRTMSIDIQ